MARFIPFSEHQTFATSAVVIGQTDRCHRVPYSVNTILFIELVGITTLIRKAVIKHTEVPMIFVFVGF